MSKKKPDVYLSKRFAEAVDYARAQHAEQTRKGSGIPYIYHLLGVASLVLEYGGDEDQAIAGLLHDVIEDCGSQHEPVVRERFGDRVADIVLACTDGTEESKAAATTPEIHWRAMRTNEEIPASCEKPCAELKSRVACLGVQRPRVGRDNLTKGKRDLMECFERKRGCVLRRIK